MPHQQVQPRLYMLPPRLEPPGVRRLGYGSLFLCPFFKLLPSELLHAALVQLTSRLRRVPQLLFSDDSGRFATLQRSPCT